MAHCVAQLYIQCSMYCILYVYYKVLFTCNFNIIQSGTTVKHVELLRLIKQNRTHKQLAQRFWLLLNRCDINVTFSGVFKTQN